MTPTELIRLRRSVGINKPIKVKRVGPQQFPKAIEIEYFKELKAIITAEKERYLKVLRPQLATLAGRLDAADGASVERAKEIISRMKAESVLSDERVAERVRTQGRRIADANRKQIQKQMRQAISVELPLRDVGIGDRLRAWTTENVSLIKSLPDETYGKIERVLLSGLNDGKRWEVIAEEIESRFEVGESRAALIARDQVGKFYGTVNRERQTELGLTHYFWDTSRDERVRPEHAAREGERFAWDDAPSDGHPGQPINCRCTPRPDFSGLIEK